MAMKPEFWAGKNVLITGHTGFKGAWLTLWLHELRAHVMGFALPPATSPNLFEWIGVAKEIRSTYNDIRDAAATMAAVREFAPDIVFHLAAQSLVRRSYREPAATYATNVLGTVNVLDAVRATPSVKAVVVVTSDKCYENFAWDRGYREGDPLGGHDPYSSSKACAELAVTAYRRSFFAKPKTDAAVASARAGNVIGGGDWADDRLVPDCVRAWSENRSVCLRYPQATRPWQHVLDPLCGYLCLAERLFCHGHEYAEAWNFGPDDNGLAAVETVVANLASLWNVRDGWTVDATATFHEAAALRLDSSKAKSRLHWRPRWDLPTALKHTADWYLAHRDRPQDAVDVTCRQIDDYQAALF